MKRKRTQQIEVDVFAIVRKVGLALPDVEAATRYDGSPTLKVGGSFMAGLATHPSAEPGTLVVKYELEARERLLEDAPETYYLTDYYRRYPLVLVPVTVAFWLPRIILDSGRLRLPASWSIAQLAALVPLGLGAAIYLRCVWEFATRGRGIPAPIDHPKELVVTGLYRYVRNPMYLGALLFLLGEALFLQYRDFLLYTLGWLAFVHLNVLLYEEPNLKRKFGRSYEKYTQAVGRWAPGRKYHEAD